jgi:hypothetical protein
LLEKQQFPKQFVSEKIVKEIYVLNINLDLRNTTPGYGFHFQHGNFLQRFQSKTLRMVRAEYGYPKGSPDNKELKKKSAATALNTVPASVHTQMT